MKNEILEFISESKMDGNGIDLVNQFHIKTSNNEINNKLNKSVKVLDIQNGIDFVMSLNNSFESVKTRKIIKNSLVDNLLSEHLPFWLVFSIKEN
jgi:chitinase